MEALTGVEKTVEDGRLKRRDAGLDIVVLALSNALPDTTAADGTRVWFRDRLRALHDRIVIGATDNHDRAVLASVPPDALSDAGVTAKQVIAHLALGFRTF